MRKQVDTGDRVVARVAARQHGVVTRAQLREAGLSAGGIARRIEAGRIYRVHRGVYASGHPRLSNEGQWMAAVLAFGPAAALSHRNAAELWGLLPIRARLIAVTVPDRNGRVNGAGFSSIALPHCGR